MKLSKRFSGTSIKLIMSQRGAPYWAECSEGMFSLNFGYSSMSVKIQDKGHTHHERQPINPLIKIREEDQLLKVIAAPTNDAELNLM